MLQKVQTRALQNVMWICLLPIVMWIVGLFVYDLTFSLAATLRHLLHSGYVTIAVIAFMTLLSIGVVSLIFSLFFTIRPKIAALAAAIYAIYLFSSYYPALPPLYRNIFRGIPPLFPLVMDMTTLALSAPVGALFCKLGARIRAMWTKTRHNKPSKESHSNQKYMVAVELFWKTRT